MQCCQIVVHRDRITVATYHGTHIYQEPVVLASVAVWRCVACSCQLAILPKLYTNDGVGHHLMLRTYVCTVCGIDASFMQLATFIQSLRAVHHGTLFDKTRFTFALCVHLIIIGYSKLFLTTGVTDIVAYVFTICPLCVCL